MNERLSSEVSAFLDELRDVCVRHGFQLATTDYDGLDIWDLTENDEPIYSNGIWDCTKYAPDREDDRS